MGRKWPPTFAGTPTGISPHTTPTVRRFQSQPRGTRLIVSEKAAAKEHVFTIVGTATADDRTWRPPTQSVTLVVSAPEKETAAVAAPAK